MKRLLLILLLLPSVSQAGVIQHVTKAYLEATYLPLSGGTLTGPLTVSSATITTLNANNVVRNTTGTSGCTDSGQEVCVNDDLKVDGVLVLEEQASAPSAVTDYASVFTTSANDLKYIDGDGTEHTAHSPGIPTMQPWFFSNNNISGTHYLAGGYDYAAAAEVALTNASPTFTLGAASDDEPTGAHLTVICKGDGATDGSDLVLTITGNSVTDAGVYNGADSEVILPDALLATCATNGYAETTKKWVGEITGTLTSTAGTTFNWSGNPTFAAYADSFNNDFTIIGFECRGQAGANTSLEIELLHHSAVGWTYSAGAFVPGNSVLAKMSDLYSGGEVQLTTGKGFNFKRVGLSTVVTGSALEGYVIRVTTGANNAVNHMTCHVGVEF